MAIALRKSHEGYSMPTYNARYPGFDENDYAKLDGLATSRGLTGQRKTNFMDQAYQQYYPQVLNNHMLDKRQEQINQGVADNGTALLNGDKNTLWKMRLTDLSQQAKMARGISYDVDDMEVINAMKKGIPDGEQLLLNYLNNGDKEIFYKAGIDDNPREKLKENFWSNLWDNMRTMAAEPVDSMKKWSVRTMNEATSALFPKIVKKVLGDTLPAEMGINFDDYVESFSEGVLDPRLKNLSLEYQDQVNQNAMERRARNLDQDIKDYYDSKGYTKLLKEGDFKGFIYKSMGDAASNWEMPVIIGASIFQPEVGLALMATDTYARENQEAFENMMNSGADYEQAQEGAVVVGLINAGVEVTLDRLLGGVETTASNEIRRIFMKNVQDEAVKKGLGGILMKAGTTQLKSSAEEGLEEVVQQIVQNAAVKTVNENQKLFEGIPQAFEGGFYNPMNLLAGGGNLTSNINANKSEVRQSIMNGAYNAGGALGTAYGKAQNMFSKKNNANTTTTATENTNIIDKVTDWGAEKITNTVSAQDKLYKAQEPRMNTLTSKKNLEQRRQNSDRANQLIIENGYVPTNTSERLDAHKATLDKLWKQIEGQINQGKGIEIDQTSIIDELEKYINSKKDLNVAAIEPDIAALEKELEFIKKSQENGGTDLPILENRKQVYNDIIDWKGQEASEVYKGGLRLLTSEIGKIEDQLLSNVPGEFAQQKKDVGALLDTYEDVFKADMKNQRSKGMGLTEAYSRIEGVGDIVEGALGILSGQGGKVISGAGKVLLGKSLAKAKDVDFLIKQGYEALAKEMGKEVPTTTDTTVETEVSEEENSKTPIYKSEKVDIIEPSLDTNLSQMETKQTNQSLIEDVKGMKVGDQIKLTSDHGEGGIITKTEYGDYRMQPYYRFTEKLSPDERLYTEEDIVEYLQDYGDRIHYEFIGENMGNPSSNSEQITEVRSYTAEELGLPPVSATMLKNLDRSKYIPVEDPQTKKVVFYKVEDLEENFQLSEQKQGDTLDWLDKVSDKEIQKIDGIIKRTLSKEEYNTWKDRKGNVSEGRALFSRLTSLFGYDKTSSILKEAGYDAYSNDDKLYKFENGKTYREGQPNDYDRAKKTKGKTKQYADNSYKPSITMSEKTISKKQAKENVNNLISDTWSDIGDEGDWDWYKKMKKKDVITYLEDQVLDEYRRSNYGLEWSEVQKLIKKFVNQKMK